MEKIYLISLFILLFIFLFPINVNAIQKSEGFIDYLTEIIYRNCEGRNLQIKENPLFHVESGEPKLTLIKEEGLKSGNYDREMLKIILQWFSSREPFGEFVLGAKEKGLVGITPTFTTESEGKTLSFVNDGRNMLSCDENTLDINKTHYYWNDKKIEVPIQETYFTMFKTDNLTLFGFNFISNGGVTVFGYAFLGIGLTLVGSLIFILKKYRSGKF